MFRMRKNISIGLSLLIAGALALAACSSGANNENNENENGNGTPAPTLTVPFETTAMPEISGTPVGVADHPGEAVTAEAGLPMPTTAVTPLPVQVTESGIMTTGIPGAVGTVMPSPMAVITSGVRLNRVSELIGYEIKDNHGQELGRVNSLVVDAHGQIHYLILDAEHDVNANGQYVAVPWQAFAYNRQAGEDESHFYYNLDRSALAQAPAIKDDQSLAVTSPDWVTNLYTYWSNQVPSLPNTGANGAQANGLIRLQDVTNHNIVNQNGDDLGDVNDMILQPDQGNIPYVILGAGGFLGLGERQIPVPFEDLSWNNQANGSFVLNVNSDELKNAPTLDVNALPDTLTAGWDQAIRNFWDQLTPAVTATP